MTFSPRIRRWLVVLLAAAALLGAAWEVAARMEWLPSATEQWEPRVPVVAPRNAAESRPPTNAVVLFDGKDLSQWVSAKDGTPAAWTLADGMMTVVKNADNIETRRRFRNYRLHLEWRVPANVTGSGQWRGNSGLFLASTGPGDAGYELQILDSYRNETYVNGMAGAIYKQHAPLANPARPPGEWQSYDVDWTAPVFAADGSLKSPAMVTAWFNGVLVQDHFALTGETRFIGKPSYHAHGPSPIKLQAHPDPSAPVSFRNIWLVELP